MLILRKDYQMKVAFIFLPPWDPHYPSYAMALFKGSTKESGHEFFGFDLNVDLYNSAQEEDKKLWTSQVANLWDAESENIHRKFSEYIDSCIEKMIGMGIDLYALSINLYSRPLASYIARKIKKINPAAQVLIGGSQCFPAYSGVGILANKNLDAVCTGEGDLIWPKVLDHFAKNGNLHLDIPGLSYRNAAGEIVDNGVPEIVWDLNSLPIADYSGVDFGKYGNLFHFSMMTSRGCINSCAFCSERPNFSKYRHRSAENVYKEIAKHLGDLRNNPVSPAGEHVVPYISFNDSLIDGVPAELEKFCDMVIEGGLKFKWGGMALIRKELTPELLVKMNKAGCHNLAWGLESGCQEVLDLMHKKFFNMDLAKEVIKRAHDAGITQAISLIAGFPGETEAMFQKTTEFVAEYKQYFAVGVQPMMIANNSLVHNKPEKFGVAAGSDWLKWQTLDGTNNYEVRLNRVEKLQKALKGDLHTIDHGDTLHSDTSESDTLVVAGAKALKKRIAAHLSHRVKQRIRDGFRRFNIRI
jgi:anaerobic magnesium-protoporphyrin IX monomethyl ester cyclase